MRLKGIDEAATKMLLGLICSFFSERINPKNGIKTLNLNKIYLFDMKKRNFGVFCLVVGGFYITFASEYIFYIKLVMDNMAVYKYINIKRCIPDIERRVMII